jgi:hypothetical protein
MRKNSTVSEINTSDIHPIWFGLNKVWWSSESSMANYEALKDSLNKNGEVMIRLDTGESIELHIHNVKFVDRTKEIVVDSGTQITWIGADRVSYYWIHKEGFEKE